MSRPAAFSLVRRLTAVVAAGAALIVLANMAVIAVVLVPLVDDQLEDKVRQVAQARQALLATPAAGRAALAAALQPLGLAVVQAEPAPLQPEPNRPPLPMLDEASAAALALEVGRSSVSGRPDLLLRGRFEVDGGRWWVSTRLPPPRLPPLMPSLLLLLLVGGAAALAATISVRAYAQPMADIARALRARRGSLHPIDEPARASVELHELIAAFNDLVRAAQVGDERRRQALAGLSHDLRTPLARLRLRAECALPDEALRPMEADFDTLDRMISQFVAYTHASSTEQASGQQLPLPQIVEATVRRYRERHAVSIDPSVREVTQRFPDLALHRVLANLIDNALAYGAAPVAVVARQADGELRILVRDAGPGIAPQDLATALAPFGKLDAARPRPGASGLGLAIVDQVAQQLGGRVVVEPFDGQGSAVGLAVPLIKVQG
ncbi:HAMP domain-containing sensor histidine kinase [Ideonella sp. DXS22W]|uniref:histidine kinase n=1 Tax=Pseudaquabacterium inlustre TaxID=2984192 RepID=A0ABU9CM41_9BURK